jgi:hypothetical protein
MSAHICFCMFSSIVWKIYVGFVANIDIKILGVPPLGVGHAFLRQRHMHKRGGGYLFMLRFSSLYDAIHGWMMGRTDGWTDGWTGHVMKKVSWKTTTMSFTICNLSITTSYWWLLLLAVFHFGL